MKDVDYGQVKWIEDKVFKIWSTIKVVYDKHATGELINGVQNAKDSMDMLPTWNPSMIIDRSNYGFIKGTCKSVVELEYHLEEVFKATNDQLDWHNPEGNPYPHDLSKPLPLIMNERGRQVIPLDHFINNDLECLKGGSSSKKYTTSITTMKDVDYGQVKWIEDKVFKIWSTIKVIYDKHATGELINGVQNAKDSMDMLPTWNPHTMSTPGT
nr:hypothetical protein [Tanacetum cinerariifolium]